MSCNSVSNEAHHDPCSARLSISADFVGLCHDAFASAVNNNITYADMRLLNTETLEFVEFVEQTPSYCILSHRWGPREATYQQFLHYLKLKVTTASNGGSTFDGGASNSHAVRPSAQDRRRKRFLTRLTRPFKIRNSKDDSTSRQQAKEKTLLHQKNSESSRSTPNEAMHPVDFNRPIQKALGFCQKARSLGYEWVWMDSICIDRRNLAELSEAVTSMYRWYQEAALCLVFLEDVSNATASEIARSEWFSRGWTLQELIAPSDVRFYGVDWVDLGTKGTLENTIVLVTGIPVEVLRNPRSIRWYSAAQRLSWAANRRTTRPEDIAYALLGLFNINMSLMYGEGAGNAFVRLQSEILKTTGDESMFVWEPTADDLTATADLRYPDTDAGAMNIVDRSRLTGILATRPEQFAEAGDIELFSGYEPPAPLKFTNLGVKLKRKVYVLKDVTLAEPDVETRNPGITTTDFTSSVILVPLPCRSKRSGAQMYLMVAEDVASIPNKRYCRVTLSDRSSIQSCNLLNADSVGEEISLNVRVSWPLNASLIHETSSAARVTDTSLQEGHIRMYNVTMGPLTQLCMGGP